MVEYLESVAAAAPRIVDATWVTLQLAFGGAAVAFVVAVLLGLAGISRFAWLHVPARIVVEFFRGTSLVVQLFFMFYVFPQFGIEWDRMVVGIMALGLNYGAYGSEVVRGSLNAVPKGQWEATTALSMSTVHKLRRIIWPQGWALMLPGLNNLLVMLVKGTALAQFIILTDITFLADDLRRTMGTWGAYGIAFVLYYLINLLASSGLRVVERRAQRRLGLIPAKVRRRTLAAVPQAGA